MSADRNLTLIPTELAGTNRSGCHLEPLLNGLSANGLGGTPNLSVQKTERFHPLRVAWLTDGYERA